MTTTQTTSRRRLAAAALLLGAGAGLAALVGPAAVAGAEPVIRPAPAPASDRYVAIAYSPTNKFSGLSINTTREGAMGEATYRCSTKADDCRVVAWTKNGCAAVAVNGDQFFGWHGSSYAEAQNGALQRAGGGSIMQSQCVVR